MYMYLTKQTNKQTNKRLVFPWRTCLRALAPPCWRSGRVRLAAARMAALAALLRARTRRQKPRRAPGHALQHAHLHFLQALSNAKAGGHAGGLAHGWDWAQIARADAQDPLLLRRNAGGTF